MKFNSADRGSITAQEIKFLADTSDLLYNCINKQYAQQLVQKVDSDVLNQVIY